MPSVTAVQSPPPNPRPAPLSKDEEVERLALRERLRLLRSIDYFARAWYGTLLSLILTGVLWRVSDGWPASRWPTLVSGGLTLAAWVFSGLNFLRSRAEAHDEAGDLARFRQLDARAPKAPELF
jgi:hypothetical protein